MSDSTRDQTFDATPKQTAEPATSADERVKDLDPKTAEDEAGEVSGGLSVPKTSGGWVRSDDEGPKESITF